MKSNNLLVKFLIWRIKHIPNKNFILILSGVIGIVTGFAAVSVKTSVHYIQDFLTSSFDIKYANYLYIGYPLIGILLTLFIAKFFFWRKPGPWYYQYFLCHFQKVGYHQQDQDLFKNNNQRLNCWIRWLSGTGGAGDSDRLGYWFKHWHLDAFKL